MLRFFKPSAMISLMLSLYIRNWTAVKEKLFLKKDPLSVVRWVGGTETRRASKGTDRQGGKEGRGRRGGCSPKDTAASRLRGEEPEGFGSSSFLLMSLFSCCISESMRREDRLRKGGLLRGDKGRGMQRGSGCLCGQRKGSAELLSQ